MAPLIPDVISDCIILATMLHIFSLLRKGENIAYQRQDSEGICYGHIISRPEPHQIIVSSYERCEYNPDDYLQDSDPHITQLPYLSCSSTTVTINVTNVISIIFVFRTEDIFSKPLPLNLEGIENFFRIKEPSSEFVSMPSVSISECFLNTVKVIQRLLIKSLNSSSLRQVNHTHSQLHEVTATQWDFLKHRLSHSTVSSGYRTERIIYDGLTKASKRWKIRKESMVIDTDEDMLRFYSCFGKYSTIGARTKYPSAAPGTPYSHVQGSTYLNKLTKVEFMYISVQGTLSIKCFYSTIHRSLLSYSDL